MGAVQPGWLLVEGSEVEGLGGWCEDGFFHSLLVLIRMDSGMVEWCGKVVMG